MYDKLIIGAIAGDIIGSAMQGSGKNTEVSLMFTGESDFSADSVFTIAVMDSLLNGKDYAQNLQLYGRKYPGRGYGITLMKWIRQDVPKPYHSWNNGAALRISPVGFACRTVSEVLSESMRCASVSHSHPDGIKGAQAVAVSVFLAKNGRSKEEIRDFVESTFGYNLCRTIDEIRPAYYYDQSAQGSVPEAIIAFLDSTDYESAVSLAISLGGGGSVATIAGGIAQAFYKEIPEDITRGVTERLSPELFETIDVFSKTYPVSLFY